MSDVNRKCFAYGAPWTVSRLFRKFQHDMQQDFGNTLSCSLSNLPPIETVCKLIAKTFALNSPGSAAVIGSQPIVVIDAGGDNIAYQFQTQTMESSQTPVSSLHPDIILYYLMPNSTGCFRRDEVQCKGLSLPYRDQVVFYSLIRSWMILR